jgi:hypothetical protein
MSSKQEHPIQAMGFWMFGFLSLVLAVLTKRRCLFFFLFLDNLSRSVEGQGWKRFWPCSGRFEVVVLFGMLSLVAQLVYWSRIVSGLNQEHA